MLTLGPVEFVWELPSGQSLEGFNRFYRDVGSIGEVSYLKVLVEEVVSWHRVQLVLEAHHAFEGLLLVIIEIRVNFRVDRPDCIECCPFVCIVGSQVCNVLNGLNLPTMFKVGHIQPKERFLWVFFFAGFSGLDVLAQHLLPAVLGNPLSSVTQEVAVDLTAT